MSGHNPPLTCKDVTRALGILGFELRKPTSGTSHDAYVGDFRGSFRKVTVDYPKAPFQHDLIASMAKPSRVAQERAVRRCER